MEDASITRSIQEGPHTTELQSAVVGEEQVESLRSL